MAELHSCNAASAGQNTPIPLDNAGLLIYNITEEIKKEENGIRWKKN